MIGMSWHEYLNSKAPEPYKALQQARQGILNNYNRQKWEDELVERITKRVLLSIDTGEAVGKIKELDNLIKNLGK